LIHGVHAIAPDGTASVLVAFEKPGSAEFPAHHALLSAGVVIVEGLDLSETEQGEYDLVCLPLRLVGADGAPARVLLRSRS
jgi:arylformamidase